jgi:CRP/FNR family transcriptional regulator, cyclic AMP receptor protein
MDGVSLFSEAPNGTAGDSLAKRAGIAAPAGTVAVFDEALELLRGLTDADAAELSRVRVPVLEVERGPWHPPTLRADARSHFGLLVLDGVVLRRVSLYRRTGAELLGSGDLLQPWVRQPPYDTLFAVAGWEVLERSRFAVLDQRFAARVAPWPEVAAALLGRATERARMLAFQHVASHIPGLEARLLSLMWALADRWGRVTPDGVLIPLRLTHATLAELVGASRPSVSTALSRLAREGILDRAPCGWLLDKSAPSERVRPGTGASTAPTGSAAPAARALG